MASRSDRRQKKRVSTDARSVLLRVEQAAALHAQGRLAQAEAAYLEILGAAPAQVDALHLLGTLRSQQGRHDDAVVLLERALAVRPDYAEAHGNLGNALAAAGRHEEALASYRKAVRLKPSHAPGHYNLGNLLCTLHRYAEAVESFGKAIELDSTATAPWFNRGNALRALGRLPEAAESYARAAAVEPGFIQAQSSLASVLASIGRYEEALGWCRKVLARFPNSAETHNNAAIALIRLGRPGEAVIHGSRACALMPATAAPHINLGLALARSGRHEEAEATYRHCLSMQPDSVEALHNMADVLRRREKVDEAAACYEKILMLQPDNRHAQHLLASLKGENPERPPARYVAELFDEYADKFEEHLVRGLHYSMPTQLAALLTELPDVPAAPWDVLDLGCGTGLMGAAIKAHVRTLTGVDLSGKMLARAAASGLYTRLEQADLLSAMHGEADASIDVITAADVFEYLGSLDDVCAQAQRVLRPGGVFGFTVEALESALSGAEAGQSDYRLRPSGRYAHSAAYLSRLAEEYRFRREHASLRTIRTENDASIEGWVVLWRKGNASPLPGPAVVPTGPLR